MRLPCLFCYAWSMFSQHRYHIKIIHRIFIHFISHSFLPDDKIILFRSPLTWQSTQQMLMVSAHYVFLMLWKLVALLERWSSIKPQPVNCMEKSRKSHRRRQLHFTRDLHMVSLDINEFSLPVYQLFYIYSKNSKHILSEANVLGVFVSYVIWLLSMKLAYICSF